jgi:hypothetical protein
MKELDCVHRAASEPKIEQGLDSSGPSAVKY